MSWEDPVCVQGTEDWVPARVHLRKEAQARSELRCAGCGATEIQKVRVVFEGGTSHAVSRSNFVGATLDFEDGSTPIFGTSQQRTTQTTELAVRCAPPRKEDYVTKESPVLWILAGCAFCFGVFLFVAALKIPALMMIGAAMLIFLGALVATPGKRTQRLAGAYYHAALSDWEKRYFCHRCGHMGEPAKETR